VVDLYSKAAVRKSVKKKKEKSGREERIFEVLPRGAWEIHRVKTDVDISRR
jgi:hypothetical protein